MYLDLVLETLLGPPSSWDLNSPVVLNINHLVKDNVVGSLYSYLDFR